MNTLGDHIPDLVNLKQTFTHGLPDQAMKGFHHVQMPAEPHASKVRRQWVACVISLAAIER